MLKYNYNNKYKKYNMSQQSWIVLSTLILGLVTGGGIMLYHNQSHAEDDENNPADDSLDDVTDETDEDSLDEDKKVHKKVLKAKSIKSKKQAKKTHGTTKRRY
uniref:Uncharacterized protein n=1 Tax=viral metagenome TaxID=1070528 RepID=A0A6C0LKH5_9ZZZZ